MAFFAEGRKYRQCKGPESGTNLVHMSHGEKPSAVGLCKGGGRFDNGVAGAVPAQGSRANLGQAFYR